jgi:hypothetical protein
MYRPAPCRSCQQPVEPVQEFAYLVEMQTLDNPRLLQMIRRLPSHEGKPVRLCQSCQKHGHRARPRLNMVHAAFGFVLVSLTWRWLSVPNA